MNKHSYIYSELRENNGSLAIKASAGNSVITQSFILKESLGAIVIFSLALTVAWLALVAF